MVDPEVIVPCVLLVLLWMLIVFQLVFLIKYVRQRQRMRQVPLVWGFQLDPGDWRPNGSVNFSRIDIDSLQRSARSDPSTYVAAEHPDGSIEVARELSKV